MSVNELFVFANHTVYVMLQMSLWLAKPHNVYNKFALIVNRIGILKCDL